jgi:phosphatidylglycerol:prolipoprotein diacylglycerol transferase
MLMPHELAMTINGHWVHNLPKFVPLLPHGEQIGVRYYGLAYVLGFLGSVWLLMRYARKGRSLVPKQDVMDLLFMLMLGVFIGGRLGWFLLYHPEMLVESPLEFFRVWQGGMASHGGFIGVGCALVIYSVRRRIPFFHLSDLIVSTAPLGLMLGRIANFINGELWGKIYDGKLGIIFPESGSPGEPLSEIPPRYPSQLLEAGLEGLLLLIYFQWRFWNSDVVRRRPGQLTGEFLIAYAIVRAIGEVFREPDEGVSLIFGLSRGTFYSIFVIIGGIVILATKRQPLVLPKAEKATATL